MKHRDVLGVKVSNGGFIAIVAMAIIVLSIWGIWSQAGVTRKITSTPYSTSPVNAPFLVTFDPDIWYWRTDRRQEGRSSWSSHTVLAHQEIPDCEIDLTAGRSYMEKDWSVEHDEKILGGNDLSVNLVKYKGEPQLITYCPLPNGTTCLEVRFRTNIEACILDAEAVIGSWTGIRSTKG